MLFGKAGDIRLGGKDAKPSVSTLTWCTLSLTGTIAVGICFYSVSGPVNMFMNMPVFSGIESGTEEAVIPCLEYCFLHYGLPSYFLMTFFAMMLALIYYNGKRELKGSSTLYTLIKHTEEDISMTKTPKALNVATAVFMGALTIVLLFVGGYDALNMVIVFLGLPVVVFTIIVLAAGVKFLRHRDIYDRTYIEENGLPDPKPAKKRR